jgi:hypothetical protein
MAAAPDIEGLIRVKVPITLKDHWMNSHIGIFRTFFSGFV